MAELLQVLDELRTRGTEADLVEIARVVLRAAAEAEAAELQAPSALLQKAGALLLGAQGKPKTSVERAVRSCMRLLAAASSEPIAVEARPRTSRAPGAAPSSRRPRSASGKSGRPRPTSGPPASDSSHSETLEPAAATTTAPASPPSVAPIVASPPSAPPAPPPPSPPVVALAAAVPRPAPQRTVVKILDDAELLTEFVADCRENIALAEQALIGLESGDATDDPLGAIFRAFHTVKGSASMLGLSPITSLAHASESLMVCVRDGREPFTRAHASLALRSIDHIKTMTEQVVAAGPAGELVSSEESDQHVLVLEDAVAHPEKLRATAEATRGAHEHPQKRATPEDAPDVTRTDAADSFVRVRLERLDSLIDLVGETVIAHSMVNEEALTIETGSHDFAGKTARLGRLVRDLQSLSLSLRMVPLKPTFGKLARAVRDAAERTGKDVELVTNGEETEIDRNMVALVADPLVHMLRNAIDHGIEDAATRSAEGKPARGRVSLSAYHAAGSVVIELSDDGKGLDKERILAKAADLGLVARDAQLGDSDIYALIFEPGFSTREEASELSGRGVGMDVVRRCVDELHGHIDIRSQRGKGTTFTLRFPLTLAITDGLLVSVGSSRFIVPVANIEVSLRPKASMRVQPAGQGELLLLRNGPTPLVRLHRLFDIPDAVQEPESALILVLRDANGTYALMVDEVIGQHQVVAKALGPQARSPAVSAGAILGDGRVGLILDVSGLATCYRNVQRGSSFAFAS